MWCNRMIYVIMYVDYFFQNQWREIVVEKTVVHVYKDFERYV